ncbi:hypothetical protein ACVK1X_005553 [Pseudomonas sp. PvR086]
MANEELSKCSFGLVSDSFGYSSHAMAMLNEFCCQLHPAFDQVLDRCLSSALREKSPETES